MVAGLIPVLAVVDQRKPVLSNGASTMSKKTIIISLIAIVAIAAIVMTVFLLLKPGATKPATGVTVPDLSQNYGACDLVSTATIKAALGSPASSLTAGFDTGKASAGNGDLAQTCVYGLHKTVTAIDTTMLTDTFYTIVYIYKNEANKTSAAQINDGAVTVSGIGDKASFFTTANPTPNTTDYSLRVDVGLRSFSFAIRQTTSKAAFDATSAQTALTKLAKEVNYSKFANKN
jgi:hypothetical protein